MGLNTKGEFRVIQVLRQNKKKSVLFYLSPMKYLLKNSLKKYKSSKPHFNIFYLGKKLGQVTKTNMSLCFHHNLMPAPCEYLKHITTCLYLTCDGT